MLLHLVKYSESIGKNRIQGLGLFTERSFQMYLQAIKHHFDYDGYYNHIVFKETTADNRNAPALAMAYTRFEDFLERLRVQNLSEEQFELMARMLDPNAIDEYGNEQWSRREYAFKFGNWPRASG